MTNYIVNYYEKIRNKEIIAPKKVEKTYRYLAKKLDGTIDDGYTFDSKKAQKIITFFEKYLRHSKGKWGGKLIKLELWQKAMLSAAYGFVDADGYRQFQRVILIVAKKNGKSFIASGIGLFHLTADGEPGAEVYSVATTRDQAKITWLEAKRMRNKSSALKKRTRATISEIAYDAMDSIFKPLASNADTLDGLNVFCALMDEFQQWKLGRKLYDIVADGVTARDEPMIFMTSTAGVVREDIYDEIYSEATRIINGYEDPDGYKDPRTLAIIYELDDRKEWTDPKAWIKANPNIGVSKSVTALKEKVERAKHYPQLIKIC